MKKYGNKTIPIYVFFATLFFIALSCTGYNNSTSSTVGNYDIKVSSNGKRAFIDTYHWNGDPSDHILVFPDKEPGGAVIETLGGFIGTGVPCPFHIEAEKCSVNHVSNNPDDYEVPVSFQDMIFDLKIGSNINNIYQNLYITKTTDPYSYVGVNQPDGSVIFYRILVNVELDPANETYYLKDGIVYLTSNNEKIKLPYASEAPELIVGSENNNDRNNSEDISEDNSEDNSMNISDEFTNPMDPTAEMVLSANGRSFTVELEDNDTARAFWDKVKTDAPVIETHDYGNFEKVGDLPWELPGADEEITAKPGDLVLYNGNQISLFYGENTWSYTKLGKISASEDEIKECFGNEEKLDIQIYLEWTE